VYEIFTIRPDGTGNRLLALTPGAFPTWSPDGELLAFNRAWDGGIWSAGPDGRLAGRGHPALV
jgi:hypothetical protein